MSWSFLRFISTASTAATLALSVVLLLAACGDDTDGSATGGGGSGGGATFTAPDRADGDRTPLVDGCDDVDPARCLLPWPNDAFTRLDPASETGLRLAVPLERMNAEDDGTLLSRADGFSRVSPLVVSFSEQLDPASAQGSVRLFLAEPGHPDRGAAAPLWIEVVAAEPELALETVVVAHPRVPLAPDARSCCAPGTSPHAAPRIRASACAPCARPPSARWTRARSRW